MNLLEIDLPAPLSRIRLSDRDLNIPQDYDVWAAAAAGALGWAGPSLEQVEYIGLIDRWPEEIENRVSQEEETADVSDLSLSLLNTGEDGKTVPFSHYFLTVSPEEAEARIYQTFLGLPLSERDFLFRGTIAEPLEYNPESLTFDLVNGPARNRLVGKKVEGTDFPAAAPEAIGRVKPIIYGELNNFPALATGIGAFDLLREDFIVGQDNLLKLSDVSRFPSSGTAKVGTETLSYTGKDSVNNNLTGVSYALYNHKKGDVVWEVRSTYDFLVAGHPVKGISDVRVNGLLISLADYSLDLNNAAIKFAVHPISEFLSLHLHDVSASTSSSTTLVQYPVGMVNNKPAWWDGDEETGASTTPFGEHAMNFSNSSYGTLDTIFYWVLHDGSGAATIRRNYSAGPVLGTTSTANPGTKRWQRFADTAAGGAAWADDLYIRADSAGKPVIYEVKREANYTGSISASEAGKQIPGLDFWRGAKVTCTVQGKKDDAAGRITGTPYSLIERPDHVFKDLIINELGYPEDDLDATSFASSGTHFAANGYAFAGAIVEQEEASRLLARLALQARSWFFWDPAGRARLIFRDLVGTPFRSLKKGDLALRTLKLTHTSISETFNRINVHYDRDWLAQSMVPEAGFSALASATDATSLASFGQRERSYNFDFVRHPSMAQDLVAFYLTLHAYPRVRARFETFLNNYDLERGDFIDLTYTDLGLINHPFEIINTTLILGSAKAGRMDKIRLTAEGKMLFHQQGFGQGEYARVLFGP